MIKISLFTKHKYTNRLRKQTYGYKKGNDGGKRDTLKVWEWQIYTIIYEIAFPGSSVGKESDCSAGDLGLIPGSGRSPGERNGKSLQYSFLENPMHRGSWWATHGIARVGHNLATKHHHIWNR